MNSSQGFFPALNITLLCYSMYSAFQEGTHSSFGARFTNIASNSSGLFSSSFSKKERNTFCRP
jgi:hypothetical protein